MKRSAGALVGAALGFLSVVTSCSQSGPGSTTGTGGSGTGGTTSTGGSTGTGGSSSTGGSTGTGGTNTGGSSATGGVTGSGGSATGGLTGTGGTATGGAGGKAGGSGTGGATGGTSGGTGGSAGGSSGGINAADIVPGLLNLYWEGTCVGTRDAGGHNCPLDDNGSACPTNSDPTKQGTVRSKTINVMGTKNQAYTINIEVIGVIGTRCYSNGTRQSTASIMVDGYNNSWYIGGSPSNATDWWNSYELHVAPSTGDPSKDVYYLNAFDNSGGNYCDSEATYMVRYPASFKVLGGGTITLVLHDYNCQALQNCGSSTDSTSTCMPRTVDFQNFSKTVQNSFMGGTTQAPPTGSLVQPPVDNGSKSYNPQWLMIDVTSVTSP